MRLLFLGDIVGRQGREVVIRELPNLIKSLKTDFVTINAENAAHGYGLTAKIANQIFDAGADCITTGNHIWDQREMLTHIDQEKRILRPINYTGTIPGRGSVVLEAKNGKKVLVINAQARLFMETADDPFGAINETLKTYKMGANIDAILVDFHGEASSEKMALGHFLDGRVSLVVGTHTHIPTADLHVLANGTAYQTDAGMCGDYDSVIGMKKEAAIARFIRRVPSERLTPAMGEATLCGVFVTTDDKTGKAISAEPLRLGGSLRPQMPKVA